MKTRTLGYTGIELSTIGLGTWAHGRGGWAYSWGATDDAESEATVGAALDAGVTWVDTAAAYGVGHSEVVLGRALNGAGDSMSPMIITILSLWGLQVPLAVFLSRIWQPPTHGIWWAIATAFVVQGLLVAGWFETGRWKHRKV